MEGVFAADRFSNRIAFPGPWQELPGRWSPVVRLGGFYAAAFTRLMVLFDVGAHIEVVACRGTGKTSCVLNVALRNGQPTELP